MASPIKLLFSGLIFVVFWGLFLGKWLLIVGANYIAANGSTGVEAFFYNNLNFAVLIGFILMLILAGVFGGRD